MMKILEFLKNPVTSFSGLLVLLLIAIFFTFAMQWFGALWLAVGGSACVAIGGILGLFGNDSQSTRPNKNDELTGRDRKSLMKNSVAFTAVGGIALFVASITLALNP